MAAAIVIRPINIAAQAATMVAEFIEGAQSSEGAPLCAAELQSVVDEVLPIEVVHADDKHNWAHSVAPPAAALEAPPNGGAFLLAHASRCTLIRRRSCSGRSYCFIARSIACSASGAVTENGRRSALRFRRYTPPTGLDDFAGLFHGPQDRRGFRESESIARFR
jgi:hypothetical protein